MKRLITICSVVGILLTAGADVKATVLLLHSDGNDGATSTVDSSPSGHSPISFGGTAQLDTAEKKWGSASLLLDGDSDYLSSADSADWDIGGSLIDNWTIDFWIKFNDAAGTQYLMAQSEGFSANVWAILHDGYVGKGIRFIMMSGGNYRINTVAAGLIAADGEWHHIAICKVGASFGAYVDGQQVGFDTFTETETFSADLVVGQTGHDLLYSDGWMDEIRITHSNAFGASPNAEPSNTITVPTAPHVPEPATICLLGLGSLALLRRKRKMKKLLTICAAAGLIMAVTGTAQAVLINGGFESSDFTGWTTIGVTSIETAAYGAGPTEGTYQALVTADESSNLVSDSTIEAFLELAAGTLDGLATVDANGATTGSAIKQTITASAGDMLTFDWNFLTDEVNEGDHVPDFAFVSIVSGTSESLADAVSSTFVSSSTPFFDETGFSTFSYMFPSSGTFTLGFGVMHVDDEEVNSALLIDTIIPEPATIVLFSLGSLALLRRRRRCSQSLTH